MVCAQAQLAMLQGTADGMRALEAREAATGDVAPTPEEPGGGGDGGDEAATMGPAEAAAWHDFEEAISGSLEELRALRAQISSS